MLYEILTGRLPFRGAPAKAMLRKQYEVPLNPATRRSGVPPELDKLPLIRLFPVLAQLPQTLGADKPTIDSADQHELRTRATATLREILVRLGKRFPIVLYIDDLQWGDEDSANLIADLLRPHRD